MVTTAQKSELHVLNRQYLAVRIRIDQDRRAFIYRPDLEEQKTIIRNQIVEIQNRAISARRRKEVARTT